MTYFSALIKDLFGSDGSEDNQELHRETGDDWGTEDGGDQLIADLVEPDMFETFNDSSIEILMESSQETDVSKSGNILTF